MTNKIENIMKDTRKNVARLGLVTVLSGAIMSLGCSIPVYPLPKLPDPEPIPRELTAEDEYVSEDYSDKY